MRVLVLNLGRLADVVQMLPAFTDVKNHYAHAVIDTIVDERWGEIPHWHPAVGNVFTVPVKRWRQSLFTLSMLSSEESKRLRRQLRKFNYDWVIDLNGGWLTAGYVRSIHSASAGFSSANNKKRASSVLYNYRQPEEKYLHWVEQVRHLFSGCLSYSRPKQLADYGLESCSFNTSAKGGSVCLMLGARDTSRRMPIKEARGLIGQLADTGLCTRLVWRDRNSGDYVRSVSDGSAAEFLPRLKLSGIASVLADAKAVISVDNELSHLAAALGVPMVRLQKSDADTIHTAYGGHQSEIISQHGDWSPGVIVDQLQQLLKPESADNRQAQQPVLAQESAGSHRSRL